MTHAGFETDRSQYAAVFRSGAVLVDLATIAVEIFLLIQ
jgi:hypothetical protein